MDAYGSTGGEDSYFSAMTNTWFGFCPHGDQRWNLRFLELIRSQCLMTFQIDLRFFLSSYILISRDAIPVSELAVRGHSQWS